MELNLTFTNSGILRNELRVGIVSTVTAQGLKVNLGHAGDVSGSYIDGSRYGRGEVGELICRRLIALLWVLIQLNNSMILFNPLLSNFIAYLHLVL